MSSNQYWDTWEEGTFLQLVREELGDEAFYKLSVEDQREKAALCYLADLVVEMWLEQEKSGEEL